MTEQTRDAIDRSHLTMLPRCPTTPSQFNVLSDSSVRLRRVAGDFWVSDEDVKQNFWLEELLVESAWLNKQTGGCCARRRKKDRIINTACNPAKKRSRNGVVPKAEAVPTDTQELCHHEKESQRNIDSCTSCQQKKLVSNFTCQDGKCKLGFREPENPQYRSLRMQSYREVTIPCLNEVFSREERSDSTKRGSVRKCLIPSATMLYCDDISQYSDVDDCLYQNDLEDSASREYKVKTEPTSCASPNLGADSEVVNGVDNVAANCPDKVTECTTSINCDVSMRKLQEVANLSDQMQTNSQSKTVHKLQSLSSREVLTSRRLKREFDTLEEAGMLRIPSLSVSTSEFAKHLISRGTSDNHAESAHAESAVSYRNNDTCSRLPIFRGFADHLDILMQDETIAVEIVRKPLSATDKCDDAAIQMTPKIDHESDSWQVRLKEKLFSPTVDGERLESVLEAAREEIYDEFGFLNKDANLVDAALTNSAGSSAETETTVSSLAATTRRSRKECPPASDWRLPLLLRQPHCVGCVSPLSPLEQHGTTAGNIRPLQSRRNLLRFCPIHSSKCVSNIADSLSSHLNYFGIDYHEPLGLPPMCSCIDEPAYERWKHETEELKKQSVRESAPQTDDKEGSSTNKASISDNNTQQPRPLSSDMGSIPSRTNQPVQLQSKPKLQHSNAVDNNDTSIVTAGIDTAKLGGNIASSDMSGIPYFDVIESGVCQVCSGLKYFPFSIIEVSMNRDTKTLEDFVRLVPLGPNADVYCEGPKISVSIVCRSELQEAICWKGLEISGLERYSTIFDFCSHHYVPFHRPLDSYWMRMRRKAGIVSSNTSTVGNTCNTGDKSRKPDEACDVSTDILNSQSANVDNSTRRESLNLMSRLSNLEDNCDVIKEGYNQHNETDDVDVINSIMLKATGLPTLLGNTIHTYEIPTGWEVVVPFRRTTEKHRRPFCIQRRETRQPRVDALVSKRQLLKWFDSARMVNGCG